MKCHRKPHLGRTVSTIVLLLLAVIWVLPLLTLLMNVLKSTEEIRVNPLGFPKEIYLDSFEYALTNPNRNILILYLNTAVCTLGGVFLTVLFGGLASYYIARAKTRLAEFMRNYFFLGMVLPGVLTLVSLALVLRWLGMMGKGFLTLIPIYAASGLPFCIFVFTSFIETLPKELEYAAAIDGANKLQTFLRIVFPLLRPAAVTIAMGVGFGFWNNYMTPKLYGGGMETISLGIEVAISGHSSDWSLVFVYVFLAVLPSIIVFLCVQRYYMESLTGAVKE